MMTTSAGTVRPAKVVIMGSGSQGYRQLQPQKELVQWYMRPM